MSETAIYFLNIYLPIVVVAALSIFIVRKQLLSARQSLQNQSELIRLQKNALGVLEEIRASLKGGHADG